MKSKENRKTDIILKLSPIGGSPKNVTGIIDRGMFTGANNLHAIMDTQTCLWSLRYENGIPPLPLRQKFTGFAPLMKFVVPYMLSRNIEIVEILD